jgi:hypothetical protein
MGIYPVGESARGESRFWAVLHNAALETRDMLIEYTGVLFEANPPAAVHRAQQGGWANPMIANCGPWGRNAEVREKVESRHKILDEAPGHRRISS